MANLKHVFGGLQKDLVSPYVQVSFAGLSVRTPSTVMNNNRVVWVGRGVSN